MSRPGFIYVMTRGHNGDIKVGISIDPVRRLVQVRSAVGDSLTDIAALWAHQNPRKIESAVHRLLADHRTHGEWFAVAKYTAFDAVCQALKETEGSMIMPQKQPNHPVIRAIETVVVEQSARQADRVLQKRDWMIGYARPVNEIDTAIQIKWMIDCGLDESQIYIEKIPGAYPYRNLMMKDCREGDTVFAWSQDIFGDVIVPIEIAIKGASMMLRIT